MAATSASRRSSGDKGRARGVTTPAEVSEHSLTNGFSNGEGARVLPRPGRARQDVACGDAGYLTVTLYVRVAPPARTVIRAVPFFVAVIRPTASMLATADLDDL